jgi:hypothetical protein
MVKSHRSSASLFHWSAPQAPDYHSTLPPISRTPPGSPSTLDPFSPPISHPESRPIPSRPPSTVQVLASIHSQPYNHTHTTSLVGVTSSTPRIILASPSTSTIHYLFPSSDTRSSHLSIYEKGTSSSPGTSAASTPSLSRSSSTSGSYSASSSSRTHSIQKSTRDHEQHRIAKRSQSSVSTDTENKPIQLARKETLSRSAETTATSQILGPSKWVFSVPGSKPSIVDSGRNRERQRSKKDSISHSISANIPGTTGSLSMRTLRRQPSMADLGSRGMKAEGVRKEGLRGPNREGSVMLRDIENGQERRGCETMSRVSGKDRNDLIVACICPRNSEGEHSLGFRL